MSNSDENVLDKLDALMKRHQPAADTDVPVLTDVVAPPEIDLDAIPMLTEEVAAESTPAPTEVPQLRELEAPDFTPPELEVTPLEIIEEPASAVPEPEPAESSLPTLEFEMPPGTRYIDLTPAVEEPAAIAAEPAPPSPTPALHALSEETIQLIADTIKDDVAKVLDTQLQQALAQQLQSSLHVALDRALSSMLDQFIATIEEVVRVSIADELQKQLAPFKPPKTPE
jgi:hypothetical protein